MAVCVPEMDAVGEFVRVGETVVEGERV